jgi:CRISPR-associated protein (Cas_csx3)
MPARKTINVKLLYARTSIRKKAKKSSRNANQETKKSIRKAKEIEFQAKLDQLQTYMKKAQQIAGEGNEVVLTGRGPIWLYLKIAHALHGRAKKLIYRAPAMKKGEEQVDVVIFDHDPF